MPVKLSKTITINLEDAYDPVGVLGTPPVVGTRYAAVYGAGKHLYFQQYPVEEAIGLVQAWLDDPDCDNTIESQVRKAYDDCEEDAGHHVVTKKTPAKLALNTAQVLSLHKKYGGYLDLLDFLRYDAGAPAIGTSQWLNWLYNPDDLLCIGEN